MAHDQGPHEAPGAGAARRKNGPAPEPLAAVMDEMQNVLQRLLAAQEPAADPWAGTPPPSRRGPRRADVVTYRLRIDLQGSRPPLWRRLDVASDLFLDQMHEIIQVAFGWTDSHLHEFSSGPARHSPGTEHYLGPFQAGEGDPGVPEEDVRLDEVLAAPGDKLFYDYDFGDGWQHIIRLEALLAPRPGGPAAVCLGGRRDSPAEDCGGIGGYELACAVLDPAHPGHAGAVAEFRRVYGESADPEDMRPGRFDLGEINEALAGLRFP